MVVSVVKIDPLVSLFLLNLDFLDELKSFEE